MQLKTVQLFQIKKWVSIKYNMSSIIRVIKFSLQDIFRNFSLSLMTVMILVLMLLSVNAMVLVRVVTNKATTTIKDQIDVSIYFNNNATPDRVQELTSYIVSFPEITNYTFLSSDEALQQFKSTYGENQKIMDALDQLEENPLGPTIVLKTKEPSDYNKIIDALNVPEYRDTIEARTFEDTQRAIDKIDTITKKVEVFSLSLSIFFALIAFIIIFNTIRVTIFTQRTEINIKKLVGATNWFVRGPYLISSVIYSFVSTCIAIGIIFVAVSSIDPQFAEIFQQSDFLTSFINSSIILLFVSQFAIVLLLTIVSSLLAMRKYLRV